MAAEFSNQIDWDGQALYIEAVTDVGQGDLQGVA